MTAPPPWRSSAFNYMTDIFKGTGAAFTSVDARRSFGAPRINTVSGVRPIIRLRGAQSDDKSTMKPTQTTTSQQSSPTMPRTTFPDKLKAYVARTFEDCPLDAKPEVEAELKRIITNAFNEKIVWTVDWEEMPLPQVMLATRKAAEKQDKSRATSDSPTKSFGKFNLHEKKRKKRSEETSTSSKVNGFEKRSRNDSSFTASTDKLSQREKEKRAKRFANDNISSSSVSPYRPMSTQKTADPEAPLVGRCMNLEKKYFRLTSDPDPENVRPLYILEKTLELLKKKWRTEQNYSYICDQFKSLRQDLTVQHIKSDFTVTVYEIHARIALEKGDLGEYNQCQSQLASLYDEGLKGHEEEFKAYRILYLLHTCNRSDMNEILANLTPADKKHHPIQHALEVRSVLAIGNYHRFFRLYLEAPGMGGYLMDSFVVRERMAALACICRSYRPDIDIRFLTEELGFESDTECVTFLCDNGAQAFIQQKSGDKGLPNSIRFEANKAASIFEEAKKQAFKKVDIKGQM
ncbi:SAC3/GANP/Nin1/mts3/eIF-3 p25 family-domain-containing protein [Geopyxis carbonaria]|nr:SAC3/GANP/Nin1/mts3/eIF-3 p25 family-domain-containing protein [Geopyxis carbonaria]